MQAIFKKNILCSLILTSCLTINIEAGLEDDFDLEEMLSIEPTKRYP